LSGFPTDSWSEVLSTAIERVVDGDHWLSLEKMGDVHPTEWLDKQAMIALAESLAK
jgi:hypothetical protein